MFKKSMVATGQALQSFRGNLFHTFLSVLGIIIGVAALVVILSFIDGLEQYARGEISRTSSLNAIMIAPETAKTVDGIYMRKDSLAVLDAPHFEQLIAGLGILRKSLSTGIPTEIEIQTDSVKKMGAILFASIVDPLDTTQKVVYGRLLTAADIAEQKAVTVINGNMAKRAVGTENAATLLGKTIRYRDRSFTIVGIGAPPAQSDKDAERAGAFNIPITTLSAAELRAHAPNAFVEAPTTESVPAIKDSLKTRLAALFPGHADDFSVSSQDSRVEQVTQAFTLFRIIMGLIIGISIVVGGVGVMNVLLISVNERTVEIGIRKALGAKKRDIMQQFLTESIAVSAFGSMLGLLFGVLFTMVAAPIVRAVTKVDAFQVAYTWNTFFVVSAVAVLIGIIFGTYPATKAAKLDPVEAIRKE